MKVLKFLGTLILNLFIVLFWLVVIVLPPITMFRLDTATTTPQFNQNWFGFFGSYLGGIFGGIATLIAVIKTIKSNVKAQRENEKKEKAKSIKKSALIIYYDFKFTFDNMMDFMENYYSNYTITEHVNRVFYEILDIDKYKKFLYTFDQFYFASDWIKVVADLSDSSVFNNTDIKKIYEIYGHLMTVKESIEYMNEDTCKAALYSMNSLFDIEEMPGKEENKAIQAKEEKNKTIQVKEKDEIIKLMNTLEELAFDERPKAINKKTNKKEKKS